VSDTDYRSTAFVYGNGEILFDTWTESLQGLDLSCGRARKLVENISIAIDVLGGS